MHFIALIPLYTLVSSLPFPAGPIPPAAAEIGHVITNVAEGLTAGSSHGVAASFGEINTIGESHLINPGYQGGIPVEAAQHATSNPKTVAGARAVVSIDASSASTVGKQSAVNPKFENRHPSSGSEALVGKEVGKPSRGSSAVVYQKDANTDDFDIEAGNKQPQAAATHDQRKGESEFKKFITDPARVVSVAIPTIAMTAIVVLGLLGKLYH